MIAGALMVTLCGYNCCFVNGNSIAYCIVFAQMSQLAHDSVTQVINDNPWVRISKSKGRRSDNILSDHVVLFC